jgi:MFS family permease
MTMWAPDTTWFYPVFMLAGVANVAFWTTGITLTLEFGAEAERPAYIGLANTLVAPGTILAPLVGGWLADSAGYPAAFIASAIGRLLTVLILHVTVQDPRHVP